MRTSASDQSRTAHRKPHQMRSPDIPELTTLEYHAVYASIWSCPLNLPNSSMMTGLFAVFIAAAWSVIHCVPKLIESDAPPYESG
jgi:hypothetical protein